MLPYTYKRISKYYLLTLRVILDVFLLQLCIVGHHLYSQTQKIDAAPHSPVSLSRTIITEGPSALYLSVLYFDQCHLH